MTAHFDQIGEVFLRNIYSTPKGAIRLAVLQRDLQPILTAKKMLRILDLGGGAGQMALWYSNFGHQITVVDISSRLLEEGRASADACGRAEQIHFVEANFFALDEIFGTEEFDLVCCHAVLEWIEDGKTLLDICKKRLATGGILSLMFYNLAALIFAQHVFGNFFYLDNQLKPKRKAAKLTPHYPRHFEIISNWLDDMSLTRLKRSGVRCFYDYMKPRDQKRWTVEEICQRELLLSEHDDLLSVSRYVHEVRQK